MNKQSLATEKWQKSAGYMVKSFKLKREIVEQFEKACAEQNVSQASVITKFMQEFVKADTKDV